MVTLESSSCSPEEDDVQRRRGPRRDSRRATRRGHSWGVHTWAQSAFSHIARQRRRVLTNRHTQSAVAAEGSRGTRDKQFKCTHQVHLPLLQSSRAPHPRESHRLRDSYHTALRRQQLPHSRYNSSKMSPFCYRKIGKDQMQRSRKHSEFPA